MTGELPEAADAEPWLERHDVLARAARPPRAPRPGRQGGRATAPAGDRPGPPVPAPSRRRAPQRDPPESPAARRVRRALAPRTFARMASRTSRVRARDPPAPSGACSGITPAGGVTSSSRATLAEYASPSPNSTTMVAAARPASSMLSERSCARRSGNGDLVDGDNTHGSELFRVQLLVDLPNLRLAGLEVLRRIPELHDLLERRDALVEVAPRLVERALTLVTGEKSRAFPAEQTRGADRVAEQRRVPSRRGVPAFDRCVERLRARRRRRRARRAA